jgi:hypothetical protein
MTVERTQVIRAELEAAASRGATAAEVAAMAAQLASASTLLGECRIGPGDWAELYPVLDEDGLRFCCTHAVQHRTEVIAPSADEHRV